MFLFGPSMDEKSIIVIFEFICALYSVALAFTGKGKALKITHIVFAVLWVVVAVLNLIGA